MTEPLATITVERAGAELRAAIRGEIDLSNASSLLSELDELTARARSVDVDLSAVTYMDSSGIRFLLLLARNCAERQIRFRVVAPADSIAGGVLRLTHLDEIEIVESA